MGRHRPSPHGRQQRRIDWFQTLISKGQKPLAEADWVYRRERERGQVLHCLLIDCSASMLKGARLARVKGLLLDWSQKLYQQKAYLLVLSFSGQQTRVVYGPQKMQPFNERWIEPLQGGGATPIAQALDKTEQLLQVARRSAPQRPRCLWLLTDGRYPEQPKRPSAADECTIVDFEDSTLPLQRARQLAERWGARYISAAALDA